MFSGLNGPVNGSHEVFPTCVSKWLLKVPGKPEFQALFFRVGLGEMVELDLQGDNAIGIRSGESGFVFTDDVHQR